MVDRLNNEWADWTTFEKTEIENAFKSICESLEIKASSVFQLFRVMLIGSSVGPPLFEIFETLGKESVKERLGNALTHIQSIKTI